MATNMHGVFVLEAPTQLLPPATVDSAVQVAVGCAPVNLVENANILEPQLAYSYTEAVGKLGMTRDLMKFSLCQVIKASFTIYNVAPVILINVLDPEKHHTIITDQEVEMINRTCTIEKEGILKGHVTIREKDSEDDLTEGTDYTLSFDDNHHLKITALEAGSIPPQATRLQIGYRILAPDEVTEQDILAGIEKISDVYPKFGILPGQLLCPGWSHLPEVYNAMIAKTVKLSGRYSAFVWADIDTETADQYEDVPAVKNMNGMTAAESAILWPCWRNGNDIYYLSVIAAAHMADTDNANGGIPSRSPSNRTLRGSGICLKDGTEVILDSQRAEVLDKNGICTAINEAGWRFWGNRTAAYPGSTDVKDVFIPCRRMFLWWGNTFIRTYLQKVDDLTNRRLIESVIDSENIRANGFRAADQIAGASIALDPSLTTTDLLEGTIRFRQMIAFYTPAETIINTMEFSPDLLEQAVTG